MEIVTPDGQIIHLTRAKDGELFKEAVVHLGSLGVVTKITLDIEPTFQMRQVVYENLSMDQLKHNLDTIMGSGYSVSLFTDWQNHRISQVWIKSKVDPEGSVSNGAGVLRSDRPEAETSPPARP